VAKCRGEELTRAELGFVATGVDRLVLGTPGNEPARVVILLGASRSTSRW